MLVRMRETRTQRGAHTWVIELDGYLATNRDTPQNARRLIEWDWTHEVDFSLRVDDPLSILGEEFGIPVGAREDNPFWIFRQDTVATQLAFRHGTVCDRGYAKSYRAIRSW